MANRFANAHISKATLQATSGYLISTWARDNGLQWTVSSSNLIKPYVLTQKGLNGFTYSQGGFALADWVFGVLSSTMFDYLYTTQFSSTLSTLATIETLDQKTGDWECYQCVATLDFETVQTSGNVALYETRVSFTRPTLL